MELSATNIILGILLTIVVYCLVPVLIKLKYKHAFTKKRAHLIALINSVVLAIIFIAITSSYSEDTTWNAAPAMFYYFVNVAILTSGKSEPTSKEKKKSNTKILSKNQKKITGKLDLNRKNIIIFVIVLLMTIFTGYLLINQNNLNQQIDKLEKNETKYKNEIEKLENSISWDNHWDNINNYQNKANFLDNNIVFVIEGYGNYYYTYDCMTTIDGTYSYWAYNKEQAISRGYRQGTC